VRNKYISIILSRNEANADIFIRKFFPAGINPDQKAKIVRMLEMQRHAMLMFTSCGWFFDEVSGIETRRILHYADRAIQIAEHETQIKLHDEFLLRLALAPSNIPAIGDASRLYQKEIRPHRITLTKVGLHHAVMSVFDEPVHVKGKINYSVTEDFFERFESGDYRFVAGRYRLSSQFTYAVENLQFAAIRLGQHHVIGGYGEETDSDLFEEMYLSGRDAFRSGDINAVMSAIEQCFGTKRFSFSDLFHEDRQRVLDNLLQADLETTMRNYRNSYEKNYPVLLEMRNEKFTIPEVLRKNLEVTINAELLGLFRSAKPSVARLDRLVNEVNTWQIKLYENDLSYVASEQLSRLITELIGQQAPMTQLEMISKLLIRLNDLKIRLKLWKTQNLYFKSGKRMLGDESLKAAMRADDYLKWSIKFKAVGEQLNIRFQ
jgi:hypothetical protein